MNALVALVGAGPGDPTLLTLAAVRALSRADVVLYDALVDPAVLVHARPGAELRFVGKRAGHEGATQDEINRTLVSLARQGLRVCRLKGGDPFLFGRGSEEAEVLAREGIAFEVVPGVSAALGATAYAGISLTHRALSSSVAFVTSSEHASKSQTAHDWSKLATATQTIVIFMGVRKIRDEAARLVAHGRSPDTPTAVIQWGTRPEQRVVVAPLGQIADRCEDEGIGPPALVVVGQVASLRESLQWWDRGPLFGRRVLVTRAREQAAGLVADLLAHGARPLPFAAIAFEPPTDPEPLARSCRTVSDFDAIVFTSANGVERWFAALRASGRDARALSRAAVVAIGPATAAALERVGIRADAMPTEYRGEGAADATLAVLARDRDHPGKRVMICRAEVARDALPVALRAAGIDVEVVPVYRTVAAADGDIGALRAALEAGDVDAVMVTSSSTVDHLCDALGNDAATLLAPVVVASIGPITSESARRRGLTVSVEAAEFTVPGLVAALERYYASRSPEP